MLGRILGHARSVLRTHQVKSAGVSFAQSILLARDAVLALVQHDLATPRITPTAKQLPALAASLERYRTKKPSSRSPTYSWLFVPRIAAAVDQATYSGVRINRLETLVNTEVSYLLELDNAQATPKKTSKDRNASKEVNPLSLWERLVVAVRARLRQNPIKLKWAESGHLSGNTQVRVLDSALLDLPDFKHLLFWAVVRHADLKV
jgi:hypothetical protein